MKHQKYNYIDFSNNRNYTFASYYISNELIKSKQGSEERISLFEAPHKLEKEEREDRLDIYIKLGASISLISFISGFILDIITNSNRATLILILLIFASILIIPVNNLYKLIMSKFENLALYEHLCDYMHTDMYFQYCDLNSSLKQIQSFVKDDVIRDINLKHINKYINFHSYDPDCLKNLYFHSVKNLVPNSLIVTAVSLLTSILGSISMLIRLFQSINKNNTFLIMTAISYFIFVITATIWYSIYKHNKSVNNMKCIYYISSFGSLKMPYLLYEHDIKDKLMIINLGVKKIDNLDNELIDCTYLLIVTILPTAKFTIRDIYLKDNKIIIYIDNFFDIRSVANFNTINSIKDINDFMSLFKKFVYKHENKIALQQNS